MPRAVPADGPCLMLLPPPAGPGDNFRRQTTAADERNSSNKIQITEAALIAIASRGPMVIALPVAACSRARAVRTGRSINTKLARVSVNVNNSTVCLIDWYGHHCVAMQPANTTPAVDEAACAARIGALRRGAGSCCRQRAAVADTTAIIQVVAGNEAIAKNSLLSLTVPLQCAPARHLVSAAASGHRQWHRHHRHRHRHHRRHRRKSCRRSRSCSR